MPYDRNLDVELSQGRENLYVGAAGEHWVAACLLRRGFNTNVLPVDTGIDLLASKKSRYSGNMVLYKIQVKTTAGSRASIRFEESKIKEFIQSCVNLVVVRWPSGGFKNPKATLSVTDNFINMTVKFTEDGSVYVRNQKNPYTPFVNRFDLIEPVDNDPYSLPDYAMWSEVEGRLIDFDDRI